MNNDMYAKKLGEVHGFAKLGLEFLDRGGVAATTAFGQSVCDAMRQQLQLQLECIGDTANADKAERTLAKLRAMMEHYIGDEWNNPTELLEWSGFYFGAAGVHWHLVAGLSTDGSFATQQAIQFETWLQAAGQYIKASPVSGGI